MQEAGIYRDPGELSWVSSRSGAGCRCVIYRDPGAGCRCVIYRDPGAGCRCVIYRDPGELS